MDNNNLSAFDTPVNEIDISIPKVKGGLYVLTIAQADKAPSKSDADRETLTVMLKTTQQAQTTNNETIEAGYPLYWRLGVTPKEPDYPATRIAKSIAQLCQAAGMSSVTPRQILEDPKQLEGKTVQAKVIVQKETDDFPESNVVKSFIVSK